MKTWHVLVLAASLVLAAISGGFALGLCNRYQMTSIEGRAWNYRMDRLTGEVVVCVPTRIVGLKERQPTVPTPPPLDLFKNEKPGR
jgi:hypothetical protein